MRRPSLWLVAVALLVAAGTIGGCGGAGTKLDLRGTKGSRISHAADIVVPASVLGLTVSPQDVSETVAVGQRAYIDSLVMYGLRADNLLQATFQVSRFNRGSKYASRRFREAIVDQIGSAAPVTLQVAGQAVYLTQGNRQRIAIWFKGSYFYVLAARDDYQTPRALLRALLEVGQ